MSKCFLCGAIEQKDVAATKLTLAEYLEIPAESYSEIANVNEGHYSRRGSNGKTYYSKTVKLCTRCL